MTTVTEKNGIMVESVITGNFSVFAEDKGVTLTVVEKGYREGYGVYETDGVKYHYFDLSGDAAKAEFEEILSVKYAGSLDFITFDENIFDKFAENNGSDLFLTEEKLDEFLTFAIGLNNINKG
tara:strand:- start:593 stop:961 length:369 start_codon:yes stop_codon:yes gene_type:complete